MMGDPRQALDHHGDARQRPQRGRESVRLGPGTQRHFDASQVLEPKTGLAARAAGRL
jgi:hypothetical protein